MCVCVSLCLCLCLCLCRCVSIDVPRPQAWKMLTTHGMASTRKALEDTEQKALQCVDLALTATDALLY